MLEKYFKLKVIDEMVYYLDLFFFFPSHDRVFQHMQRAKDNSYKTIREIVQFSYLGIQGQFKTTPLTQTESYVPNRTEASSLVYVISLFKIHFSFPYLENFCIIL